MSSKPLPVMWGGAGGACLGRGMAVTLHAALTTLFTSQGQRCSKRACDLEWDRGREGLRGGVGWDEGPAADTVLSGAVTATSPACRELTHLQSRLSRQRHPGHLFPPVLNSHTQVTATTQRDRFQYGSRSSSLHTSFKMIFVSLAEDKQHP